MFAKSYKLQAAKNNSAPRVRRKLRDLIREYEKSFGISFIIFKFQRKKEKKKWLIKTFFI